MRESTCFIMPDMKKTAAALCLLSFSASATEEAMNQALQTWQQQVSAYETALKEAPSDEAREALTAPNARDIAPQLWQSMSGRTGSRRNPKGKGSIPTFEFEKAWALPGIVWILEHQQAFTAAFTDEEQAQLTYFGNAIMDSLVRVHFNAPGIGAICPSISATSSIREYELLQKIYQRNQHKDARACAALGMSLMLNNPMVSSVEGSDAMARAKRLYYLKQSILLSGKDTSFGKQPLTEVAMEQAYFLRHLSPGCVAPQLKLKDTQGIAHTLPLTGKLNLLLFWSPAEPRGTAMLRDAARLQAQYPGLEIHPIMPHATPEEQQQALEELGIEHSFCDDAQAQAARTYRIGQLPTTVLIGKDSRILYGGNPDMKLQAALDTATAAEAAAAKDARPSVTIEEAAAPVIQPGAATPATAAPRVPGLREMPEF